MMKDGRHLDGIEVRVAKENYGASTQKFLNNSLLIIIVDAFLRLSLEAVDFHSQPCPFSSSIWPFEQWRCRTFTLYRRVSSYC